MRTAVLAPIQAEGRVGEVPLAWQDDALCAQTDPDMFFPEKQGAPARSPKAICAACPVVEQCLEYALATAQTEGIWGGRTPRELRHLRRDRGMLSAPAQRSLELHSKILARLAAGVSVEAIAVELEITARTVWRARREATSLDCRDGRHAGCETCACYCHASPERTDSRS